LIINLEIYQSAIKNISMGAIQKLEMRKKLIYEDFFTLQNLINLFIYQKIIMTYV
jgi:hypothetical protein